MRHLTQRLTRPDASAADFMYSYAYSKYSYTLSSGKANQAALRSSRVYDTQRVRHVSSLSGAVMLVHVLPYSPRHQIVRLPR